MTTAVLSRDDLRRLAPGIFADRPWGGMSGRYRMVPTVEVADILRDRGFLPVRAHQSRSRIPGKGAFTRHLIRFRHRSFLDAPAPAVGGELPELVLTNSHDGTSAYRFMAGIFRLVCGNGLVVQSADFGSIGVRHSGGADFHARIIEATCRVAEEAPRTMETIGAWGGIELEPRQRLDFAAAAWELKPNPAITPEQLLRPRRPEDDRPDLWRTLNRVQENLIRGDLGGVNARGRRIRTRPVRSVEADLRINRGLWRLAESTAAALN
ncbi:DUF932 domain-containing protein [Tautonia sp. JC769]|uniref:DUF932 domain-containing protein n=1 Tax=Tautonia sp. JC769 TaxID=3232135 RepID=UPI00345991A7